MQVVEFCVAAFFVMTLGFKRQNGTDVSLFAALVGNGDNLVHNVCHLFVEVAIHIEGVTVYAVIHHRKQLLALHKGLQRTVCVQLLFILFDFNIADCHHILCRIGIGEICQSAAYCCNCQQAYNQAHSQKFLLVH